MNYTQSNTPIFNEEVIPETGVVFTNGKGKPIGLLRTKDNKLCFEGNADECAKIFFENIIKEYMNRPKAVATSDIEVNYEIVKAE